MRVKCTLTLPMWTLIIKKNMLPSTTKCKSQQMLNVIEQSRVHYVTPHSHLNKYNLHASGVGLSVRGYSMHMTSSTYLVLF